MFMTAFISKAGLHKIISIPFIPFTRYFLKLDDHLGSIVLMSYIGGYPVGATAISQLYDQNEISRKTAENMLCYCYCGAPSFIIVGVGVSIFNSAEIGIAIYLADILASIIIGRLLAHLNEKNTTSLKKSDYSIGNGFVEAVNVSVKTILVMCGYIILFSGMLEFIEKSDLVSVLPFGKQISTIISGILEVTSGCIDCGTLLGATPYYFATFFIAFGGLSVLFQIFSITQNIPINKVRILLFRVFHGILAVIISPFTLKLVPSKTIDVFLHATPPEPIFLPHSPLVSILIASMLLFIIFRPKSNCKTFYKR